MSILKKISRMCWVVHIICGLLIVTFISISILLAYQKFFGNLQLNPEKLMGDFLNSKFDSPESMLFFANSDNLNPLFGNEESSGGGIAGIIAEALKNVLKPFQDYLERLLRVLPFIVLFNLVLNPILWVVSLLCEGMGYIGGSAIIDTIFSGNSFSFASIPIIYWAISIISPLIVILVFFYQYLALLFAKAPNYSERLATIAGGCFKLFFIIFLLPVLMFLIAVASQFLFEFIRRAFATHNGGIGSNKFLLSDIIFLSGLKSGREDIIFKNLDYTRWAAALGVDSNLLKALEIISRFDLLIPLVSSALILVGLFLTLATIMMKLYEIALLFFISPVIASTYPLDDGARMKILMREFINKMLVPVLTMVSFYLFGVIFLAFRKFYEKISPKETNSVSLTQIFDIVSMVSGIMVILSAPRLVGIFIGEQTGLREGLSAARTTTNNVRSMFNVAKTSAVSPHAAIGKGMAGLIK